MVNYKKLGKLLLWRCKQKKVGSQLPTATMAEIEETETVPSILLPCTSCNRTFRPEALAKHSKVCEKILMRKRKQFDSSKQRLQGTEIESFVLQTAPKTARKKEAQLNLSKSKWKEKVEQVRSIQSLKKPIETPLSQVIKPSDHEECPYCGRSFGPKAYERHTEFCKEQIHKLKVSNNTNSEARERLKVRTTYRGPLTNKVLNRDRYQPNRNRDPSPLGLSSSEIYDETPKSRGLSRHSSLRSSLRSKPETAPPPPLRRTMTQINPSNKGARGSPKEINETDIMQKNQTFNNKPKMVSKEPIEKRMKPTNSKTFAQPSSKPAVSNPKSPPKLNNVDVNTFKELNVISCFTPLSKSDNNLKIINNPISSSVVRGTANSKTPLNIVPISKNESFDSLKADNYFKSNCDHPTCSTVVEEAIIPEIPLNTYSQRGTVTSDLPKDYNFNPRINLPKSEAVTSDLANITNHRKLFDGYGLLSTVQETKHETPLHLVLPSELKSPDSSKADGCFSPVIYHHLPFVGQETTKPENPSYIISKMDTEEVLSPNKISVYSPLTTNDNSNLTQGYSPPREMINETDHTKRFNKNLAFTIEFEPDNRFLVYEHHKVGLKKSPLIFKKRVSKSYESVNLISNTKGNIEEIENQPNTSPKPKPSIQNKNSLVIEKLESSTPEVTQSCELKMTEMEDPTLSNPFNNVTLSWRERVLEIMEVSESLNNKHFTTHLNENLNNTDSNSVLGSKSVESQSEDDNRTIKLDLNDKCTDTDNSLLINKELIDMLCSKDKPFNNVDGTTLHDSDAAHESNLKKQIQKESEENFFIGVDNIKSIKNEGCSGEVESLQNYFLDADLYFAGENSEEIGQMQEHDSLDVDVYFVEENNVASEVLKEEMCNRGEIVNCSLTKFINESDQLDLFNDLSYKNVLESHNCIDSSEVNLNNETFDENIPHLYNENNKILRKDNININDSDGTDKVLDVSFVNEYEFNDCVCSENDFVKNQAEMVTKGNDILENASGSSPRILAPKIEGGKCYRSLSDSELQKRDLTKVEVMKLDEGDNDTVVEFEEDKLSSGKNENEDSPTFIKDKILRLAGQEFVLMANKNKKSDIFEESQMNDKYDSEMENISSQVSPNNYLYQGSYKPYTYCQNTHTNSHNDNDIYSDIFSQLKRSNRKEPKMTTWQTLSYGSDSYNDCESLSEKDSLEIKFEEDSGDEFYIFQPDPPYEERAPFEALNHTFEDFNTESARYSFSSNSSSYNNGEDYRSMKTNPIINQQSSSTNPPLPFVSSKQESNNGRSTSSHIPLLKSRRNYDCKSKTLPPLFSEQKTSLNSDNQHSKKKFDASQCSNNSKNDSYPHFSHNKNSSEESPSDWDLSDYDTYEKKKTVITRSSKTIYNNYYEQVEYSQESNEYQTIKTSVSNLPLPHADFFKEKEFKLPKIQTKNVPLDKRIPKKNILDFEKLPLLRNFEDCTCSLRKEKETEEDVENRNHKLLNNSIDSAYSSLTRSSGAEGDTRKAEMSKFCHECGAKYPIAGAKFCCNCGMRRITL